MPRKASKLIWRNIALKSRLKQIKLSKYRFKLSEGAPGTWGVVLPCWREPRNSRLTKIWKVHLTILLLFCKKVDNDHLAKVAVACNIILGENASKIDEFIDIIRAKENAQAEITRLERAKEKEKEKMTVEEINNSDDDYPEGHCLIVEELTRIEESSQDEPLPVMTGGGKKKAKFK